jgi:hypothetical protein
MRALLPWWAAVILTIVALNMLRHVVPLELGGAQLDFLGFLSNAIGIVAVGALSTGHEYAHRTLGVLLAQPIDRRRVLVIKLAVLAPLLASLGLLGVGMFSRRAYPIWSWPSAGAEVWLPFTIGLFIAPWMAMLCRGPLAGMVFSLAIPALILAVSQALGAREAWAWMWESTLAVAAVGAVMTWRTFFRLEAIEGPHAEINAPAWLRIQAAKVNFGGQIASRGWQIALKELRLQQMTFIVSALYVAFWISIVMARHWVPEFSGPDLGSVSVFHGVFVAIMAGALASAEERHFGTAEWQLLLPMATRWQWWAKALLALTVAICLSVGLPVLLRALRPDVEPFPFKIDFIIALALCCVAALYVSSLSTSGMRALLASFPTILGTMLVFNSILRPIVELAAPVLRPVARVVEPWLGDVSQYQLGSNAARLLVLGFGVLLLALGSTNHTSAERGLSRLRWQGVWIALYVISALVLMAFSSALFEAWVVRTRI